MAKVSVRLLFALALVASACSSDASSSDTSSSDGAAIDEVEPTSTNVEEPDAIDVDDEVAEEDVPSETADLPSNTEAAGELALGLLNGEEIDESTYEAVFAPAFRDQLGYDDFVAFLPQLTPLGPWTVDEVLVESETELTRKVDTADGSASFVLQVIIEPADRLQISTLFISPYAPPPELASIDEGIELLQSDGELRLLIAETTSGECEAIHEVAPDEQAPLGSVFKVYVLAAVVDAVAAGSVAWDDVVEVRDELDSIPSGITQDDEPGTELSVRELAERMISISDNTATDHLIDLVGTEAVITAMADYGHSDPSRNDPFMTTRQFTILKFGGFAEEWVAADQDGRRAILDDVDERDLPPLFSITSVIDPISVNDIEWFASPNDLCRLGVAISADADALEIMRINPGIADDGRWASIAFKGGSEPGVLAAMWFVTDADGRSFVLAASLSNEDRLLDEASGLATMGVMRDLVGA